MKKITLNFFDFDGSLIDSPLPDNGKIRWSEHHGKPYPHLGWWGREESLDLDVFDIKPKDIAHAAYLRHSKDPSTHNYILTSRIPKLKDKLKAILDANDIQMIEILCAKGGLTKGQQIIELLATVESAGKTVGEINMWEDRNKEIATIEPFRVFLTSAGITLNIYKIESDAKD